MEKFVQELDSEFDDDGFFDDIHKRKFDQMKAERYLRTLASIELEGDTISIELAKMIWFIPVRLQYRLDWLEEGTPEWIEIEKFINKTHGILFDLIGAP